LAVVAQLMKLEVSLSFVSVTLEVDVFSLAIIGVIVIEVFKK